jgi:hypothetical protein
MRAYGTLIILSCAMLGGRDLVCSRSAASVSFVPCANKAIASA